MNTTSISWTEKTWNPISGCTPISEGCANCYAKRMAQRLRGRCGYPADGDPFRVILHPDRLDEPCRLRKPSRIFVCSMGDLFHEAVEGQYIREVWGIMRAASKHTFIVLTKRPHRLLAWTLQTADRLSRPIEEIWPGNCWLGVTAENQARADERIPVLLQVPAAVKFVSVEPMLGPVDIESYLIPPSERICSNCWQYREADHQEAKGTCVDLGISQQPNAVACSGFEDRRAYDFESAREWLGRIDWVVCGGETSAKARPMHPDWARSLRDQCQTAGVPFHFKSWGAYREACAPDDPIWNGQSPNLKHEHGTHFIKLNPRETGRLLDGREWDEYPEVQRCPR